MAVRAEEAERINPPYWKTQLDSLAMVLVQVGAIVYATAIAHGGNQFQWGPLMVGTFFLGRGLSLWLRPWRREKP